MIKIIYGVFLLGLISGCKIEPTPQIVNEKKDSARNVINNDLVSEPQTVTSQSTSLHASQLPSGISYKGTFYQAWKWSDSYGDNILILSENRSQKFEKELGENIQSKELFARQYRITATNELFHLWDMYDYQKECIFDLTCEFIGSPYISDVDNDGLTETTLLYKIVCRSDARPANMKLIIHEGKDKFALRGIMMMNSNGSQDSLLIFRNKELDRSKVPEEEIKKSFMREWGCFENTKDFAGSQKLKDYAIQLWRNNCVEEF